MPEDAAGKESPALRLASWSDPCNHTEGPGGRGLGTKALTFSPPTVRTSYLPVTPRFIVCRHFLQACLARA